MQKQSELSRAAAALILAYDRAKPQPHNSLKHVWDWQPHTGQRAILDNLARFNVIVCGRRFGKTEMAMHTAVSSVYSTGIPAGWFAPTYKYLNAVWRDIHKRLRPLIVTSNKTDKIIQFTNGGVLEFWTMTDDDVARSRAYHPVIIDEAAMVPNLGATWNQAIYPTLTDYNGRAYILSTPKGRNDFYHLYRKGVDPHEPDYASWQMPTSANPHIDPQVIESARLNLPADTFRQEYLAAFLEDDGAVFRNVRACVGTPQQQGRNVMGVDWAQMHDFTVLTVMNEYGEVVAVDRFNQIGWGVQRGRLKAMYDKYDVQYVLAEENSIGGPNIEELRREGMRVEGFTTTNASKQNLVIQLQLGLEREEIRIPDDDVLIGELEAYESERLPSGRWRYNAPQGQHDDMVMSLMLAYEAVLQIDRHTLRIDRNPFY